MADNTIKENFTELNDAITGYINAKINLWKVIFIEKIAKAGTYLFSAILILLSILFILLLLSMAFSFWFAAYYCTIAQGFLISAGIYTLIAIMVFLLRRRLFSNNIVKNVASIIYDEEDEENKNSESNK